MRHEHHEGATAGGTRNLRPYGVPPAMVCALHSKTGPPSITSKCSSTVARFRWRWASMRLALPSGALDEGQQGAAAAAPCSLAGPARLRKSASSHRVGQQQREERLQFSWQREQGQDHVPAAAATCRQSCDRAARMDLKRLPLLTRTAPRATTSNHGSSERTTNFTMKVKTIEKSRSVRDQKDAKPDRCRD